MVILEESNEIGGISKTVYYNGNRMDIGGHRFFSKDERVNAFWEEIMPLQGAPAFDDLVLKRRKDLAQNGPDPEEVDRVMLLRDRVSRIYYKNTFFDYPIFIIRINAIKRYIPYINLLNRCIYLSFRNIG